MADFDPVSYMMGQKAAGGGGGAGGSTTLAGLTDVDISNPTDGQTLVYDAASSKWVNGSGGGGGGGGGLLVTITESSGVYTADKTVREIMEAIENGSIVFRKVVDESAEYSDYVIGHLSEIEVYTEDNVTQWGFYFLPGQNNTPFIDGHTLYGTSDSYPSTNGGGGEN